jgi:hypothetical protein
MAFVIKNIKGSTLNSVRNIVRAIHKVGEKSRFTFTMETTHNHTQIKIGGVRLRESKHYCGNHPLPCPVRMFPVKHKNTKLLEGADWVAFNDMLNDVLDNLGVSANVASSHVIIRKGDQRCIGYGAQAAGNGIDNEWVRDSGQFAKTIGMKPFRSMYPNGTPGIPEYLTSKAKGYTIPDHD